ncbi:LOW QUALITY PROTEIN: protein EDS1B-like [Selaginella moellendorffii]|nr:LOW QUALITY PROTEIN: protein EDS1B-like [Selaginella moellendorffii]|eukprot:XP_024520246.1 LOW QUALITY PROTEIN: protein EDS1B-like [Selaginella moellendorffii]
MDSDYRLSPLWEGLQAPAHWGCNSSSDLFFESLAHRGFTRRFAEIWRDGKLTNTIEKLEDSQNIIIFTGHSLGGAIAALATLWLLYLSRTATAIKLQKLRFVCVTFGMPFVGDVKLSELAQSQGWDDHFVHVVCRHDIVPRMLLAPLKSISKSLRALLPFWNSRASATSARIKHGGAKEEAITTAAAIGEASASLVNTVVKASAQVASAVYTGFANTLLRSICKVSPYRPFGAYLFCSTSGASMIDKPVTVLQMLHLTLQEKDHGVSSKPAAHILEHTLWHYMQILQTLPDIMGKLGGEFAQMAVEETQSVFELEIALQLHALGLGIKVTAFPSRPTGLYDVWLSSRMFRTGWCFSRTGKPGKWWRPMQLTGTASLPRCYMQWQSWNGSRGSEKKMKHFKLYNDDMALEANLNRMVETNFWDETIDMYSNGLLPLTFKAQNKWVNSGHTFRLLVEPLDIANY